MPRTTSRPVPLVLAAFLGGATLLLAGCPENGNGATDAVFTLTAPEPGADWPLGSVQTIAWEQTEGETLDTVTLGLHKDGYNIARIAEGTENDGAYDWTIPAAVPAQDGYQIFLEADGARFLSEAFRLSQPQGGVAPAIGLDPVNVHDFGYTETQWTFEVWNSGTAGTTLDFDVFSNKAWLQVAPLEGTSTGEGDRKTITVTVDRDLLAPGQQSATVTVAAEGLSSKNIQVTASTPRPALEVSATAYDFGSAENTWAFEVWNSGEPFSTLDFTVFGDKAWMVVEPLSGQSTGEDDPQTIQVSLDRGALNPGNNSGTVTVTGAAVGSKTIQITALRPVPALSLSSTAHDFGATGTQWAFEVWNSGDAGSVLDFDVSSNKGWLRVAPAAGQSSGPADRKTITVNLDRGVLAPGGSNGAITVSAGGLSSKTISINANIPRPEIGVSGNAFDFGYTDTTWTFEVWNSGEPDSVLDFGVFADSVWASVDPPSGTSTGPDDRVTVTVTLDRGRLQQDAGNANITVNADDIGAQTIRLTARVPRPELAVSATAHDFGSAESSWSFDVWNAGDPGSQVAFQVSTDRQWLSVSPASGASSGADDKQPVEVTVDRQLLQTGDNSGTVSVTAPGESTRSITLTARRPTPAISLSSTSHDYGAAESSWTFDVWNSGDEGSTLAFEVFADKSWLTLSPTSEQSAGSEDRKAITATLDRDALSIGANSATITVNADGLDSKTIRITATRPQPQISVSAPSYDFERAATEWAFEVWNAGEADSLLRFQVAVDVPWLSITPEAGASSGPDDRTAVTVTLDRAALPEASNSGRITVQADGVSSKNISINATRAQPEIGLSDTQFDFGNVDTDWTFQVWNAGDPASTLDFWVETDREWLAAAPATGSSASEEDRQTITITLQRALLPTGSSSGRITVGASGAAAKTITINAQRGTPEIGLSATTHDFGGGAGPWTLDVWNTGDAGSTLNFQVFADKDWIQVSPGSGASTGADDVQGISVAIDRALLNQGNNSGAITVTAPDANPRTVSITARKPQPQIGLSSTSYDFGRTASTWTFDVWNAGDPGSTLNFLTSSDQSWIRVSPSAGASTGETDTQTIEVTIDRGGLTPGNHSGTVIVSTAQGGTTRQVSIAAATPQPAIALSGATFDFRTTQTERTFQVWNAGDPGSVLNFFVSPNQDWISVSPEEGQSTGSDDAQTITITIDRGLLSDGGNTGQITLSADDIPVQTVTVQATTPTPQVEVSATSYDFSTTDTDWSFQVWNGGESGSALQFTVEPDKEWISVTPVSGASTGPGDVQTISVTIDRGLLPATSNSGRIYVNSPDGGSKSINVNASVPQPAVSVSADSYDFGKTQTEWTFDVWNSGPAGTTLEFLVVPDSPWLSVAPPAGTSGGPGERVAVTVTIDRGQLTEAVNNGRLQVRGQNGSTKTVNLTARTPQPEVATSASGHTFALGETEWTLEVWNAGDPGTTLEFQLATDKDWLSVTPGQGSSTDINDRAQVTVQIDPGAVPPDENTGRVTIISQNGQRNDVSISVRLPQPAIGTSAQQHDFGSAGTDWAFEVWNAGDDGTTLDFYVATDQLWLSVSPISGASSGPLDRQTIAVTLDRGLLAAGDNRGNIRITADGISGQTTISVQATQAKALRVNAASKAREPDGFSWETAYTSVQAAIDRAAELHVPAVWVARGVVRETIWMHAGIDLYGGFAGVEQNLKQRPVLLQRTLIDGEHLRRCVVGAPDTLMDGFALMRGAAEAGAGVFFAEGAGAIVDCTFTGHHAERGAAVYADTASLSLVDCSFQANASTAPDGATVETGEGALVLNGCAFEGNDGRRTAARGGTVVTAVSETAESP